MGRLIKAFWDCPYCGTKEIGGDIRECPNCGRPRGSVKFYIKNAEEGVKYRQQPQNLEYVDEKKAAGIYRGPDWYCSYCDSLNTGNAQNCKGCGATREDSEKNYFDLHKKKEEPQQQYIPPTGGRRLPDGCLKKIVIAAVIVLALVLIGKFISTPKTSEWTVTDISWQRTIGIEHYENVDESDWNLPRDAHLQYTREEIHHYDSVLDHYEEVQVQRSRQVLDHYETEYSYVDLGNGYFEEETREVPVYTTEYYYETESQPVYVSVPRYQKKYYYDIWKWIQRRNAVASGEDHNTYWPQTNLAEDEREGQRSAKYVFTVTGEDDEKETYSVDESTWMELEKGDDIFITTTRIGGDPYISDKDGNRLADLENE